jgi:predicted kinase
LQERAKSSKGASEADVDVLQFQFRHSEPLNSGERKKTVFVGTDKIVDAGRIIKALKRIQR